MNAVSAWDRLQKVQEYEDATRDRLRELGDLRRKVVEHRQAQLVMCRAVVMCLRLSVRQLGGTHAEGRFPLTAESGGERR